MFRCLIDPFTELRVANFGILNAATKFLHVLDILTKNLDPML